MWHIAVSHHCTALHYAILHCTSLHCIDLTCTSLHPNELYCTAFHCTVVILWDKERYVILSHSDFPFSCYVRLYLSYWDFLRASGQQVLCLSCFFLSIFSLHNKNTMYGQSLQFCSPKLRLCHITNVSASHSLKAADLDW